MLSFFLTTFIFFKFIILVHNITSRHQLLVETIGVRDEERESYEMINYLHSVLTPIFLTSLFLETAFFFIYTNLVLNLIIIFAYR